MWIAVYFESMNVLTSDNDNDNNNNNNDNINDNDNDNDKFTDRLFVNKPVAIGYTLVRNL